MKRHKLLEFFTDVVFIGPALTAFFLIVIIPLVLGVFYSFTDWNGVRFNQVVGVTNYITVFNDPRFVSAFFRTFRFAGAAVVCINLIGFSLALLVTTAMPGTSIMRAVFYLPNLIGGLILGFIWNFIFVEVFPAIGGALGVNFLFGWLSNAQTGFWGLVILISWQMSGYMMVIYIAALQSIPADVVEAAAIDGANAIKKLKYITLPLVAPAFTISIFLTLANTFRMYDQNVALTGGGPGSSTQLVAMDIFQTAFVREQNAQGQAKAIIFLIVVMAITLSQVYFSKKKEAA